MHLNLYFKRGKLKKNVTGIWRDAYGYIPGGLGVSLISICQKPNNLIQLQDLKCLINILQR